ncbi:hypothetical protein KKG71_06130, partial [Patescibacteria group bacterium]|nr:hypothetical protein [Patescibacteria group bacterium]
NTSRVILQTDGTILAGNMVRLWTKLLGRQISVTKPLLTSNLADYLFAKLSLSEIQIWRATLMVGIGFPKAAEFAIQSYLETSYSQPLSGYITSLVGQSLFHKGKYLSASRKFFEAAKLYAIEGNLVASLKEKLREVDSLRCYGAYFRAKKLLISVDNESTGLIDDGLNGMVARHKVLMFKQKFDLLSTFKMSRKSRKITTETKPILKYAYKLALINGNWHDIQMCEMWANRMKIPLSEIADGVISPLPSREGFTQIGYFVGKWMALRDIAIHEKDNGKYLLELNESLFETIALGNDPETWKLSFLLITKSRLRFFNNIYYFLKGFYSCEYNIFFRFFLILRAFVTNSV